MDEQTIQNWETVRQYLNASLPKNKQNHTPIKLTPNQQLLVDMIQHTSIVSNKDKEI